MSDHLAVEKTLFGFWIYLLTDLMMFSALFAVYAVLQHSTFGGPSARDLLSPSYGLFLSVILLMASTMFGIADFFLQKKKQKKAFGFLFLTFALGIFFWTFEMHELIRLVELGYGWEKSAFLSALFTLVGTHAAHIFFGLLWFLVFFVIHRRFGMTDIMLRRWSCLRMFWQFLNLIWVFIFSFLYLLGSYA